MLIDQEGVVPFAVANASSLADALEDRRQALMRVLLRIATHASAEAEITESISVLRRLDREAEHIAQLGPGHSIVAFMPSNNILYSVVLYALVPSTWGTWVSMRPSSRVKAEYFDLIDVLAGIIPPEVSILDITQRECTTLAKDADIVVFTGNPDNGAAIASQLPHRVRFLGFGSGPNPVVLGPDVDIQLSVEDLIDSRLFNGGQDCLCPDIVFVHESVINDVQAALVRGLSRIPIGSRSTQGLVNCPLVYADAAEVTNAYLERHNENIVWAAHEAPTLDFVPMTVLRSDFHEGLTLPEFFAPVFNLVTYVSPGNVLEWLEGHKENGFYLSTYGEPRLAACDVIRNAVNCGPRSALAAEDGNSPFGGFGLRASWVSVNGRRQGKPLLLSQEMALMCSQA